MATNMDYSYNKSCNEDSDTARLYPHDIDTNQGQAQIPMLLEEPKPSAPDQSVKGQYFIQKNVLGPDSSMTICQFCHATIRTFTNHTVTARTHIAAALCCLVCCCCCIPYCSNSAKNTDHYCPACKTFVGTYKK